MVFEVIKGKTVVKESTSLTTGTDILGSSTTTSSHTLTDYDWITFKGKKYYVPLKTTTTVSQKGEDIFGGAWSSTGYTITQEYSEKTWDGKLIYGYDINGIDAFTGGEFSVTTIGSGSDIFGNSTETKTTMVFEVIKGKTVVKESTSLTTGTDILGSSTTTSSHTLTDYDWITFKGKKYYVPLKTTTTVSQKGEDIFGGAWSSTGYTITQEYSEKTWDGKLIYGYDINGIDAFTGGEFSVTTIGSGSDIFGNSTETKTTMVFEVIKGKTVVKESTSLTTGTDILGSSTTTSSHTLTDYDWITFKGKKYYVPLKTTTTVSQKGEDIFGGAWSSTGYTITQEYSEKTWDGKLIYGYDINGIDAFTGGEFSVTTIGSGSDIFGNSTETKTTMVFEVIKGKTVVKESTSLTTGTDILGSSTTTSSHTLTDYDWITFKGKKYYVPLKTTTTVSQKGEDIFGGAWSSTGYTITQEYSEKTWDGKLIYGYDINGIDAFTGGEFSVTTIGSGSDIFGNSTETKTTMVFEVIKGKTVVKESTSLTTGTDILGSSTTTSSHTLTDYDWITFKGKKYYVPLKTTTTVSQKGEDIFGGAWSSTGYTITQEYSEKTWDGKLIYGYDINGIDAFTGGEFSVTTIGSGSDIFGNSTETKTTMVFEVIKGKTVVKESTSLTTGTDILGSSTTTSSHTLTDYDWITFKGKKYYVPLKTTTTVSQKGEDIFGGAWSSTGYTITQEYSEKTWDGKLIYGYDINGIDAFTGGEFSVTTIGSGSDIFGNSTETKTTMVFEVIKGKTVVKESTSLTTGTDILGSSTTTSSHTLTDYDWITFKGKKYYVPLKTTTTVSQKGEDIFGGAWSSTGYTITQEYSEKTWDGKLIYGYDINGIDAFTGGEFSVTTIGSGSDIFGNSTETKTTMVFEVIKGKTVVKESTSLTTGTDILGSSTTTSSHTLTDYDWITFKGKKYYVPLKTTTTVSQKGEDIFGGAWSSTGYTITQEYSEKTWDGKLIYGYDINGIDAFTGGEFSVTTIGSGSDIFGNSTETKTTMVFEVIKGKTVVKESTSLTTGTDILGSSTTTSSHTLTDYDWITFKGKKYYVPLKTTTTVSQKGEDIFGGAWSSTGYTITQEYSEKTWDGKLIYGYDINGIDAFTGGEFSVTTIGSGSDIFGNSTETKTTMVFEVIKGKTVVKESTSLTTGTDILGSSTTTSSHTLTDYDWITFKGKKYYVPLKTTTTVSQKGEDIFGGAWSSTGYTITQEYSEKTWDGKLIYGYDINGIDAFTGGEFSVTTIGSGSDIFGNSTETKTTMVFEVIKGKTVVKESTSLTTGTDILGSSTTTSSHTLTDYDWITFKGKKYYVPLKTTTTVSQKGEDIFGGAWSSTGYTITQEYSEKTWDGKLIYGYDINGIDAFTGGEFSVTTIGSGSDIFGNSTETNTTMVFEVIKGKTVVKESTSLTTGTDILGSSTTTSSHTLTDYDWITFKGKKYYVPLKTTTTVSQKGEDIFGGAWSSTGYTITQEYSEKTWDGKLIYGYDINGIDAFTGGEFSVTTIGSGSDIFGNSTETKTTMVFEVIKGKTVVKESTSLTTGTDILGSSTTTSSHTLTDYDWITFKGKKYYVPLKTTTTVSQKGEDIFGGAWSSTGYTITQEYSEKTWDGKLIYGYDINGIDAFTGGEFSVTTIGSGSDIFGNSTETKTTMVFEVIKGKTVVKESTSLTTGTDILGSSTTTSSHTLTDYDWITFKGKKYYVPLKTTTTVSQKGEDIFGGAWSSTGYTITQEYSEKTWDGKLIYGYDINGIDAFTGGEFSVTTIGSGSDIFGNSTETKTTMVFEVIKGKTVVKESTSLTTGTDILGSSTTTSSHTLTDYDWITFKGKKYYVPLKTTTTVSQKGEDIFGGAWSSTGYTITQEYSEKTWDGKLIYGYDINGIDAFTGGEFSVTTIGSGSDIFGNSTETKTTMVFEVIKGKTVVKESTSLTTGTDILGSSTTTSSHTLTDYDWITFKGKKYYVPLKTTTTVSQKGEDIFGGAWSSTGYTITQEYSEKTWDGKLIYGYDINGIDAFTGGEFSVTTIGSGSDIFGNSTETKTTMVFEVIKGKTVVKESTSLTTGTDILGSSTTTSSHTLTDYDWITFKGKKYYVPLKTTTTVSQKGEDIFGGAWSSTGYTITQEYSEKTWDGKLIYGYDINGIDAFTGGEFSVTTIGSGSDIFGNSTETKTTMVFEVIKGKTVVKESTSLTTGTDILGSSTTTSSHTLTDYDWITFKGKKYYVPLKTTTTVSQKGEDIFGGAWSSTGYTITQEYSEKTWDGKLIYGYDINGIDAFTGGEFSVTTIGSGSDIFGNSTETKTTMVFEVIKGKTVVKESTSLTTGTDILGSSTTTSSHTLTDYDWITFKGKKYYVPLKTTTTVSQKGEDIFGGAWSSTGYTITQEYSEKTWDGKLIYGYDINGIDAFTGGEFTVTTIGSGSDIFGNSTETNTTMVFEVIKGKTVVKESTSLTTGTDILGSSTTTSSHTLTDYDWITFKGKKYYVPLKTTTTVSQKGEDIFGGAWSSTGYTITQEYSEKTWDGKLIYGYDINGIDAFTGGEFSVTTIGSGSDIFGNSTETKTTMVFEVIKGKTVVKESTSLTTGTDILGSSTTTSSHTLTDYDWITFKGKKYYVPLKTTTTVSQKGEDIFGGAWSSTGYTITQEYSEKTWDGKLIYGYDINGIDAFTGGEFTVTTIGSGSDIFGNSTETNTTMVFEVIKGKTVVKESTSLTTGTDILGSSTTTSSHTLTDYDWITFKGKKYYVPLKTTTTVSQKGEDIFGGAWSSTGYTITQEYSEKTWDGKLIYGYDINGIDAFTGGEFSVTTIGSGSDIFGNSTETKTTMVFEVIKGKTVVKESTSLTTGTDILGSSTTTSSHTLTDYDWITFKGKKYYVPLKTTTTVSQKGEDIFGGAWSSTGYTITQEYSEKTWDGKLIYGYDINGIDAFTGGEFSVTTIGSGSDIFGNSTETKTTMVFEVIKGKTVVKESTSLTTGTDILGSSTTTSSHTLTDYDWITFKGKKYYVPLKTTTTVSQKGEDIFGGAWTSTGYTITQDYMKKTWAGKTVWGFNIEGIDAYNEDFSKTFTKTMTA